jgi:hypothetical protein
MGYDELGFYQNIDNRLRTLEERQEEMCNILH